jgi:hypothetical protein
VISNLNRRILTLFPKAKAHIEQNIVETGIGSISEGIAYTDLKPQDLGDIEHRIDSRLKDVKVTVPGISASK